MIILRLAAGPHALPLIIDALIAYADHDPDTAPAALRLANQIGDALDAMPAPTRGQP